MSNIEGQRKVAEAGNKLLHLCVILRGEVSCINVGGTFDAYVNRLDNIQRSRDCILAARAEYISLVKEHGSGIATDYLLSELAAHNKRFVADDHIMARIFEADADEQD